MSRPPVTALVLSGGGARAAYQVGVLRALARLRRERVPAHRRTGNPFDIIVGTSAGAINAAALATHADRFDAAVEILGRVWQDFSADQVYRADSWGVIRSGARWLTMLSLGWAITRWRRGHPHALLDNAPLAELLRRLVPLERLPQMLAEGHLQALAVTASSYTRGEHVTFYAAGRPVPPWTRSQRVARPSALTHAHLLASSAIPFVFPAARLDDAEFTGWYGDGSMRQTAPLSPAIHLGGERLLIIGAGRMHEPPGQHREAGGTPSLAQIAGHALANIFLDALAVDVERMQRINATLALLPPQALQRTRLRPVESLVISPSCRLDDLAGQHLDSLPGPVRTLLHGVGVGGQGPRASGAALASYLLFEAPYTRALMALGEADTLAREAEVCRFFGWSSAPGPAPEPSALAEGDVADAVVR